MLGRGADEIACDGVRHGQRQAGREGGERGREDGTGLRWEAGRGSGSGGTGRVFVAARISRAGARAKRTAKRAPIAPARVRFGGARAAGEGRDDARSARGTGAARLRARARGSWRERAPARAGTAAPRQPGRRSTVAALPDAETPARGSARRSPAAIQHGQEPGRLQKGRLDARGARNPPASPPRAAPKDPLRAREPEARGPRGAARSRWSGVARWRVTPRTRASARRRPGTRTAHRIYSGCTLRGSQRFPGRARRRPPRAAPSFPLPRRRRPRADAGARGRGRPTGRGWGVGAESRGRGSERAPVGRRPPPESAPSFPRPLAPSRRPRVSPFLPLRAMPPASVLPSPPPPPRRARRLFRAALNAGRTLGRSGGAPWGGGGRGSTLDAQGEPPVLLPRLLPLSLRCRRPAPARFFRVPLPHLRTGALPPACSARPSASPARASPLSPPPRSHASRPTPHVPSTRRRTSLCVWRSRAMVRRTGARSRMRSRAGLARAVVCGGATSSTPR